MSNLEFIVLAAVLAIAAVATFHLVLRHYFEEAPWIDLKGNFHIE